MCNQISFIKPYFDIYAAIKNRQEIKMEDDDTGVCIAIPHAVNVPYQDLFSYLHNGKTDYIYIETIKITNLLPDYYVRIKTDIYQIRIPVFLSEKLMEFYIISQVQNFGNIIMSMLCF